MPLPTQPVYFLPLSETALAAFLDVGQIPASALERAGLFIQPVDSLRQWFAYHPLFACFLQNELSTHQPQRVAELHLRAAEALLEEKMPEEAARHAVLARDPQRITQVLQSHGRQFYRQGRLALLQR